MRLLALSLIPPSLLYTIAELITAQADPPSTVFDPSAWFGLLGPLFAAIGILGVAWGAKQSGAVKAWRETAEAAKTRAEVIEKEQIRLDGIVSERTKALELLNEQLTHTNEMLVIEQKKRDLTPLFESVLKMNEQGQARFAQAMQTLNEHSEAVKARHEQILSNQAEILRRLTELAPKSKQHPQGRS